MSETTEVALACRMLAHLGLVEDVLGHVSARVGPDTALVRCRGPRERGLLHTLPEDILPVSISTGELLEPGEHRPPNELALHLAVLRARPDVQSVVHAHPPEVVLASLAGLVPRPLFGAYNIPATRLAMAGISTYPRMGLVNDEESGRELATALGPTQACVLRGHGLVSVGRSLAEAVVVARNVDVLCRTALRLRALGREPDDLEPADLDRLPDLGAAFNVDQLWGWLRAELRLRGLDLSLDAKVATRHALAH